MTTPDLQPLLDVHVLGTPRPQGNHVPFVAANGKARLREKRGTAAQWRNAVVDKAHQMIRAGCHDDGIQQCGHLQPGYPHDGPVKVTVVLHLAKPAKPKDPHYPSTRNTGDVEKHQRTLSDALQAAGVIADDCQIVDLAISKRWAVYEQPGAHITVWPAAAADLTESPRPGAVTQTPAPGGANPAITNTSESGVRYHNGHRQRRRTDGSESWVCAEPHGIFGECGMPVQSEPCPIHHPATEGLTT